MAKIKFDVPKKDINHKETFELLYESVRKWIDLKDCYRKLLGLWIMCASVNQSFVSFPYLYFNAVKGSGKSRVLHLLSDLLGGSHTANITEAVLFRKTTPIMIDEAENMGMKEKSLLRELLNMGYKKGGIVERARKDPSTGKIIIESYPVYRAVALANINGIDDVLQSRCLVIPLEKSFNKEITRRVEFFDLDPSLLTLKKRFSVVSGVKCSFGSSVDGVYREVCYILNANNTLLNYTNYILHNTTLNYTNNTKEIIERIEKSDLQGREMELWLPIFTMASLISTDLLDEMFELAEEMTKIRVETDVLESRDMNLISFLHYSYLPKKALGEYCSIMEITKEFVAEDQEEKWINSKWVGRALRRINVISHPRRLSKGVEVILNKEKIEMLVNKYNLSYETTSIIEEKQKTLINK